MSNQEEQLWDKFHNLIWMKITDLGTTQIKELLQSNPPQFARGHLFHHLEWIPKEETFAFWKSEVQHHIIEPQEKIYLENFPNEYVYRASLWEFEGRKVIFLEMIH